MFTSGLFSAITGYLTILCAAGQQLPQMMQNFRQKSCEGLSLPFLILFFLGDVLFLIGCILADQLAFQRYLAMYCISVDCVMLGQYYHYSKLLDQPRPMITRVSTAELYASQRRNTAHPLPSPPARCKREVIRRYLTSNFRAKIFSILTVLLLVVCGSVFAFQAHGLQGPSKRVTEISGPPAEFPNQEIFNDISTRRNQQELGQCFAWMSSALYLCSRMPQLWKNYSRKSVKGLSMYFFSCSVVANVLYTSSILTSPRMLSSDSGYLHRSIPFLVASIGIIMLDGTVLFQSRIYYNPSEQLRYGNCTIAVNTAGEAA